MLSSSRWFRDRLHRGGLVWIEQDNHSIAGLTYDIQGRSLRLLSFACTRGDAALLHIGAVSATYLACFDLARQLGCDVVDFRTCRPCLNDGLLRVKRSWQGHVVEPDDITHDVRAGWHASTPAVTDFITRSPLVVRHGRGFAGVRSSATDAPAPRVPPGISQFPRIRPAATFGDWTISKRDFMRVVITNGTNDVGGCVARSLRRAGFEVHAVDSRLRHATVRGACKQLGIRRAGSLSRQAALAVLSEPPGSVVVKPALDVGLPPDFGT